MRIYIPYYSGKTSIVQETTFTRNAFVLARIVIIIIIIIIIMISAPDEGALDLLGEPAGLGAEANY